MSKDDLIFSISHNLNAKPLRELLKNMFPIFNGKSEVDCYDFIKSSMVTKDHLKSILYYSIDSIAKDIFVFRLEHPTRTFNLQNITNRLTNDRQLIEKIKTHPFVHEAEIDAPNKRIAFLTKGTFKYYTVDDSENPTSNVLSAVIYVPTLIQFKDETIIKMTFGKLKINKSIHNHITLGKINITQIKFNPDQIAAVIDNEILRVIGGQNLIPLNLTTGIINFVNQHKISTSHFGWLEPNGEDGNEKWKQNSTLFRYDYVLGKLTTALEVHPAKWYLTDANVPAQTQEIKKLNSLSIAPKNGIIKTSKYSEETLDVQINEFIDNANY